MKKISIIVPIYNISEKLLRRCITSILGQTERELEILLVNDGSPDKSGEICDEYSAQDSRIRVFHMENKGVSVARNIGINQAMSDYITFIDPDDYLREDCVEKTLAMAVETDADMLLYRKKTDSKITLDADETVCTVGLDEMKEYAICTMTKNDGVYNIGMCWAKVFKREFLEKNHLRYVPGIKKAQDRLFVFDCYQCRPKVTCFNYVGYFYTENYELSICRRYNPDITDILSHTAKEFHKHVDSFDIQQTRAKFLMDVLYIGEMFQMYFAHEKNEESLKILSQKLRNIATQEPFKTSIAKIDSKGLPKRLRFIIFFLRLHLYTQLIVGYRKLVRK